ncbi:uncharacterized protein LOC112693116 [Sipha flava]|uniref:Uncharacterized protein LOC112693116 n=1 Tax=Sipha flava TaxID=143950 RepID=A0A8B8GN94_9HEMI|nr:uncharacterized protein LOC112693116 [Sipha flava]
MTTASRRALNSQKIMENIKDTLKKINFSHIGMITRENALVPPWTAKLDINLEINILQKNVTLPHTYRQYFMQIRELFKDYTEIYTDGSKSDKGVGAAVACQDTEIMLRLPNECSIYTAEAQAIIQALDLIKNKNIQKAIIFSDSLSTLKSIQNSIRPNEIARTIQNQIYTLQKENIIIQIIWIPSHTNIIGNERADKLAKEAIVSPNAIQCQVYSIADIKQIIKKTILNIWQNEWKSSNTKLNEIKNHILPWPNNTLTRKEEVVINRLRIGHTRLTHAFLMKKEDPPICPTCNDPMTVKHIINDCRKYELQRQKYNLTNHIAENLNIDTTNVLKFLRDTELHKKI